jgi:hypothetical protein
MDELRSCIFCGHVSHESIGQCPTCQRKRKFLTKKQLLIKGWLQLLCGLFLVGLMGTITFNLLPSLLHAGHEVGGKIFTGTPEQIKLILILFSLIIMTGLACTLMGLWMIIAKRINKWLYWLTIGLFASVFIAVAYVLIYF